MGVRVSMERPATCAGCGVIVCDLAVRGGVTLTQMVAHDRSCDWHDVRAGQRCRHDGDCYLPVTLLDGLDDGGGA